jgi:hypothetical protein
VNWDQVSYTTRPVTQVAEQDVNSAFINGMPSPVLLAAGRHRSPAPSRIISAKPSANSREVLIVFLIFKARNASKK